MALLIPPEDLEMKDNMEEAWPLFKQRFMLYLKATGAANWPSGQKVALFLTVAGPKALEVYNSFYLDSKNEEDFERVLACFESHFTPHRNETYERFLFRTRLQELHESLDDFVADLQLKSRVCNFGDQRESLVRDQLVLGCRDNHARQQLLQNEGLTLEDALQICHLAEEREEARYSKDIRRRSDQSKAEKQIQSQVGNAKENNSQALRQKKHRVPRMRHRADYWQQQWENSPRKESFRTYV